MLGRGAGLALASSPGSHQSPCPTALWSRKGRAGKRGSRVPRLTAREVLGARAPAGSSGRQGLLCRAGTPGAAPALPLTSCAG